MYIDNNHILDDAKKLVKQVGINLRKLRQERGISIQELAEATDVSKLTLGNIERGEANPSLAILWKLANGLTVPLSALISVEHEVSISRTNSGKKIISENDACTFEYMFDDTSYGSIEIHRATIKPNSEYKYSSGAHQPGVIEYMTVMKGELKIKIEDDYFHLNEYDAIKFDGDKDHTYINSTDTEAVLHFVMNYTNV
jgi:transcriptional regulator with XRE-family HTH domain